MNVWLIVILLVGVIIVLVDGLSRGPVTEREAFWNGPLEYQPYTGALWLAGATLPLMFGYARRAGISVGKGLFLWFVFCTASYTRDFSYLHWPGTILFVTDVVLLVLFIWTYIAPGSRESRLPSPVGELLILWMAAGALAAARGFLGHHDPIFVLRDGAMVAYALFLPVTHRLFGDWLSIKRIVIWFALGTGLSVLNGMAWFLAASQERRFIYYGIYVLIALVGTLVAQANRLLSGLPGWMFTGLFGLGLALANARSLFVGFAALVVTGLCGDLLLLRKGVRIGSAAATLATVIILTSTIALFFLRTEAGRDFADRSRQELASGVLNSGEDANWQFRLSAWKEAWTRFEEYPLTGEGFGIAFVFELLPFDNDPRPHNTFLTVLYKMGLLGFLPLLALLGCFFWRTASAMRRNSSTRGVVFVWIALLTESAFCFYGAANLLLESPFLASLFWGFMGVGLKMVRMLDAERLLLRASHGG